MIDGHAKEVSTFEAFDKLVLDAALTAQGPLVLLTGTLTSPTTKQIIAGFLATPAASMSSMMPTPTAAYPGRPRRIDEKNPKMSKHYQFESLLSMTGGNADERYRRQTFRIRRRCPGIAGRVFSLGVAP